MDTLNEKETTYSERIELKRLCRLTVFRKRTMLSIRIRPKATTVRNLFGPHTRAGDVSHLVQVGPVHAESLSLREKTIRVYNTSDSYLSQMCQVTHPVVKQQEHGLLCALVIILKSWLNLVVRSETHK